MVSARSGMPRVELGPNPLILSVDVASSISDHMDFLTFDGYVQRIQGAVPEQEATVRFIANHFKDGVIMARQHEVMYPPAGFSVPGRISVAKQKLGERLVMVVTKFLARQEGVVAFWGPEEMTDPRTGDQHLLFAYDDGREVHGVSLRLGVTSGAQQLLEEKAESAERQKQMRKMIRNNLANNELGAGTLSDEDDEDTDA